MAARVNIEKVVQRVLQRRRERELKVETDAVKYARAHGWLARKMNGSGYRDWPDRLFVPRKTKSQDNWDFWVEFKKVGEEPRISQQNLIDDLVERGQIVYVCDNIDDFIAKFHTIDDIVKNSRPKYARR